MMQTDPFASVRVNRKTQEPQQLTQQNSEDPFNSVRIKKSESFPWVYETGRHAARIGSRIAETIGGIPGDVSSLVQSGVLSGLEKLVGIKSDESIREKLKKDRLPTSGELKEISHKATKGFTKAQDPTEEFIDEIAETASSLLGPMKFRKALGIGLGSTIAKKALEVTGLGEGVQDSAKLGTMFLMSLYNPGGASKFASLQYDKAKNLSKGASVKAMGLETSLKNLVDNLETGVSTSSKNSVIKPAKELLDKIKDGKISVQDLTSAKRDINSLIGEPDTLKGAKKLLNSLGKQVDNAIKPYEKINPEFAKAYRPANEIFGAVAEGNKAQNFIYKTLGAKSFIGTLLAELALGQPQAILPTVGGAAGAIGLAKAFDFSKRLAKSPELRKYYSKALVSAAKEDLASLRLYEEKIQDILKKD